MPGTGYIGDGDVSDADKQMLERLWSAVQELAAQSPSVECISCLSGPVWFGTPGVDDALLEALDAAQAELQVGFKTVADHIGAQPSDWSPGWRRVAAWYTRRMRAVEKARNADSGSLQ